MKSIRSLYYSLLGLLGGLVSWVLIQSWFHVIDALSTTGILVMENVWLKNIFFEGAVVGLGLGMVLQVRASLWYHHNLVLVLSKMFFGSLIGVMSGFLCFGFGSFMQMWEISPWLCRITSWTLLGLFIVGTTELLRLHSGYFWSLIFSGGIGGFMGGGIFELLLLYQISGTYNLYGLILAGFSISFIIGINENRVTSCALKILSGPQEGQMFLLDQKNFTIGHGSHNDFILNNYAEVCNVHAKIFKKDNQIFIEKVDAENEVMVNYRLIDLQSMKKGDVLKIGTALLQYYEK